MEHRSNPGRGEMALERLLQRIDAAVDEYRYARRISSNRYRQSATTHDDLADADQVDVYWQAWWGLPLAIRDWLLWVTPSYWSLSAGAFRRLLLMTAGLVVRQNMPAHVALRRAAARLRLPPPRSAIRPFRAVGRPTHAQTRALSSPYSRRTTFVRRSRPVRALRAAPRLPRIARSGGLGIRRGGGFARRFR